MTLTQTLGRYTQIAYQPLAHLRSWWNRQPNDDRFMAKGITLALAIAATGYGLLVPKPEIFQGHAIYGSYDRQRATARFE